MPTMNQQTITAAVCHQDKMPLRIEEVVLGTAAKNEVEVRYKACAICHSDIAYIQGMWPGAFPAIYGHEAAGIVTGIGEDVQHVAVGDHVLVTLVRACGSCHYCSQARPVLCETQFPLDQTSPLRTTSGQPIAQGMRTAAFAESGVVHGSQVIRIPKSLPFVTASLISCGVLTGMGAVRNSAKIPAGCQVVVIGTGGVGINSVQGAAMAGADRIIAIDVSDTKLQLAQSLGATHLINSTEQDPIATVRDLTQMRGADYVLVTVGSIAALEQGVQMLGKGGTLVVVGMTQQGTEMRFDNTTLAGYEQRIIGCKMGSTQPQSDVPQYIDLYERGLLKLDPLLSDCYPLVEINEALAASQAAENLRNVIVL